MVDQGDSSKRHQASCHGQAGCHQTYGETNGLMPAVMNKGVVWMNSTPMLRCQLLLGYISLYIHTNALLSISLGRVSSLETCFMVSFMVSPLRL